ncbi:efflux RND transporter periplasmic adaptor subunit [Polyangium jinanense]|uniref:Efflux RND transporter periplasmic adaptor subunit n=1 Tax=Polyangium jinanense TaxID=2829994 RepID=A0A9X4AQJ4_9BACT|nr:efflux RND transporter periplasmic adaptor subunit [Polyangium jinanense]MDC3953734.1 efflux RND transporter periplasmic adaptor subunit [Polyangium jinanense]MDC3979145.1 efflux RND transporter periplasmic adaptor subunit [Polyangium jinanense]
MANPGVHLDAGGQARNNAAERPDLNKALSRVEGRGKWLRWLVILLVLGGIVAGGMLYLQKTKPPPPARYVSAALTQGDVFETIQSTGQVKPVTEVQIGAQVSGRITKVHVDFNSHVKAGDLLAEIDTQLLGAEIDANAAQVAAANASVKRADANLETAKVRLERARKVFKEGVGSQADLDAAQGSYDIALADVAASKAQVAQLNATLRRSNTNLAFTKIYSPIEGVVINRAVDPGQTVAASFQTPTLFVIAQDLRKMRVLADIDEADVGRLKEGMTADIRVDAFPGESFKGLVSQVRFSPVNQAGVVTYAAVIEVENPDIKLRPGMTATATIHSAEAKGIKRLPNAALRFKPSPPMTKEGKPIPQDPLPPLPAGKGRIYVLTNETLGAEQIEMREVDIGITDGIYTVLRTDIGSLKVVTEETDAGAAGGRGGRRPF